VPSDVDLKLRLGLFRLLQRKYHPTIGEESKFLAAAIVNWALAEVPGNEEAKMFSEANSSRIQEEAERIHLDIKVAGALSILYTFTLIRLGPTDPDMSLSLVERAAALHIWILSSHDVCPTHNALEFLAFVDEYANSLLRS